MHRQRENPCAEVFRDREVAWFVAEVFVGFLQVQRDRVVDRRGDARFLQRGHELRAVVGGVGEYGVLRPAGGVAFRDFGNLDAALEAGAVGGGNLVSQVEFVVEDGEFFVDDRRLDGVEAPVEADADIVVFVIAPSVHANGDQQFQQLVVVGEDRAAVAVAAERLGRKEGGRADEAEASGLSAANRAAESLRGVFENPEPVLDSHLFEAIVLGGQAEKIDRNERLRVESFTASLFDCRTDFGRVDVEGAGQHIDEHRRRAREADHLGGGHEGEWRGEHGVAGANPFGHEWNEQRVGAGGARNAVLRADVPGELLLGFEHFRPHDELGAVDDPLDTLHEVLADAVFLGDEVYELHGICGL